MAENDDRANVLRILIATDNHLGVWEKDEVRKDDSFNSFEEILQLAVQNEVDCVLLGGDLFHDNKPSRATLQRTMAIMSKYVLSDRPISFQIMSDQAQNFVGGRVNFEDPNVNVGLPIFTIHGNHDDPAGADSLSAVDLLSTARLVNYFGKIPFAGPGVGKIRLAPILLAKGTTQLALYGLGNLRDERLARMFQTPGTVEWVRPAEAPGYPQDAWFNVFVLHQNRLQHGASTKNTVREDYLAKFLDFVIWGHEHECILEPWDSPAGDFAVLQPGSSVATALSEGEAKAKHVQLLEVLGAQFRLVKLPLTTVRPFVFSQVALQEELEVEADDQEALADFLERRVEQMCQRAVRSAPPSDKPVLPLVRLRVDYTGFSTINVQRFGQKFVGKVANPHDVLLWHKAPAARARTTGAQAQPDSAAAAAAAQERGVEDLIAENLLQNLEILPESDLAAALHEFVEKDEKGALAKCVERSLEATQAATEGETAAAEAADQGGDIGALIAEQASRRRMQQELEATAQRARQPAAAQRNASPAGPSAMEVDAARDGGGSTVVAGTPATSQRSAGSREGRGGRQSTLDAALSRGGAPSQRQAGGRPSAAAPAASDAPSHDGGRQRSTQQSRATPARRGAGRASAGRAAARMQIDGEDSEAYEDKISDAAEDLGDDIEDSSTDEAPTPLPAARGRGRAAKAPAGSAGGGRAAGSRKRQAAAVAPAAANGAVGSFIDSDEEEAATARRRPAGRMLPASLGRQSQAASQGRAAHRR